VLGIASPWDTAHGRCWFSDHVHSSSEPAGTDAPRAAQLAQQATAHITGRAGNAGKHADQLVKIGALPGVRLGSASSPTQRSRAGLRTPSHNSSWRNSPTFSIYRTSTTRTPAKLKLARSLGIVEAISSMSTLDVGRRRDQVTSPRITAGMKEG
jgi:hypothetical protein